MKTTIDLPDTLLRQARHRALHEGRTFKDLVAEVIRQGLSQVGAKPATRPGSPLELGLEHTTLAAADQQRAGFPG